MTTTDSFAMTPPPAPTPAPRRLRRSRSDRVGAGVAGGLGTYFGIDPVLFRVLFATAAFFGGAGVLAYLLAWAAIPEDGTEHAAIDGWVTTLRRRRVPFWLIVTAAAFVLWLVAFSWWAPGPFVPVMVVVLIVVAIASHRARPPASDPVDLTKRTPAPTDPPTATGAPTWVSETRNWISESRIARRERRRRAMPIRIATLVSFVLAMVVLGLVDAAHGIAISTYFWFALAILGAGFLVGVVVRRTTWGVLALIVPVAVGTVAFAGTSASLRDGVGQKQWQPTTVPASSYQLALGRGVLDLRSLPVASSAQTVRVDLGAGRVKIIAPADRNVVVDANVHFGTIDSKSFTTQRDGHSVFTGANRWNGVNINRTIAAPDGAVGAALTIDVHLTDGEISVVRR